MENVAIKGRGGNDVQHKNWKGKILRIWITIIRHGGLGHQVQESWPYLSIATPWPYELSHVKNEFSLVGLTACLHVKSSIFKFRTPPLPLSPALIGFFVFFFFK